MRADHRPDFGHDEFTQHRDAGPQPRCELVGPGCIGQMMDGHIDRIVPGARDSQVFEASDGA
jgi:hypothetical protein